MALSHTHTPTHTTLQQPFEVQGSEIQGCVAEIQGCLLAMKGTFADIQALQCRAILWRNRVLFGSHSPSLSHALTHTHTHTQHCRNLVMRLHQNYSGNTGLISENIGLFC